MPSANYPAAATTFAKDGFHKVGDLLTGTLQTTLTGASTTVEIDAALASEMDAGDIDDNFMLLVDDIEQIFCSTRSGQTCTIAAGGRGAGNPTTPVSDRTAGALIEVVFSSPYLERIRLELAAVIAEIGITGNQNFLRVDGTEAMLANLDMGGFAISNVGNVDGRDVSADWTTSAAHFAASSGIHGVVGNIVGTTDAQTLTSKILTAPTINAGVLSGIFSGAHEYSGAATFSDATSPIITAKLGPASGQQHTLPAVASDVVALLAATQTFTGKTLTAPVIATLGPSGAQQHTVPAVTSDTFALLNATQTIAGKTFTAPIASTIGPSSGQQHTLPAVTSDVIALLAAAQAMTNKTFTSATNILGGVTMTLGSDGTGDVYYRAAGGALTRLAAGSAGQVLGVSGGLPAWGASTGVAWTEVTGTSQQMAVNNGYIANNAGLVTLTLPDTAPVGSTVRVIGKGVGGWRIAQNASEQIIWNEGGVDGSNETTVGTGGRLDSTDDYDAIELVCTVANTTWTVLSAKGNIALT